MKDYWSNSKVADIIRGIKKPNSATTEEWADWEKKAKSIVSVNCCKFLLIIRA